MNIRFKERGDFVKTLQEALQTVEAMDIEFKSCIKVLKMKELAFANCKGGMVYFGVEDNCEVTGCIGNYDV